VLNKLKDEKETRDMFRLRLRLLVAIAVAVGIFRLDFNSNLDESNNIFVTTALKDGDFAEYLRAANNNDRAKQWRTVHSLSFANLLSDTFGPIPLLQPFYSDTLPTLQANAFEHISVGAFSNLNLLRHVVVVGQDTNATGGHL